VRAPWLAPLGAVWGTCAAARAGLYRSGVLRPARLERPVISVGNLAVGGRGKTPIVRWLALLLRDHGLTVSVLSRGYGGSFRGELLVVEASTPAALAGDEPVMLARELPGVVVAVGRRRAVAGRQVEERFGPRVHVLDDGFQHLSLARDLDLLCVEPADLDARPLPAGPLREFPSALARAHLVLIQGADSAAAASARARLGEERTCVWHRMPLGFVGLDGAPRERPRRAVLLSGIAAPQAFEADVRGLGVEVAGHARYRDHHPYRPKEVAAAVARAEAAGAEAVVTTAKDAVRLGAPAPGPPILVLRSGVRIEGEERLRARILDTAGRRS
jgi:tetraacyldisaccharide 4'-kinase